MFTHRMIEIPLVGLHQRKKLLFGGRIPNFRRSHAKELAVELVRVRGTRIGMIQLIGIACGGDALVERLFALTNILGSLVIVDARMLSLQRRQPTLDSVAKQFGERAVLQAQPRIVLEDKLLEAGTTAKPVDVRLKVDDRVAWHTAEHQFARFVVEEAGDCFDFKAVRVDDPNLVEVRVRLGVAPDRRNS